MNELKLTYAGLLYFDRTLALRMGEVRPDGIDFDYEVFDNPGLLFRQQTQLATYDVAEMSVSTFMMLVARGDQRFVGLPVFLSRNFRHSQIYLSREANIRAPGDLRGCRVGVPEYQQTAALWIRAILSHDYGVSPEEIHWFTGGRRTPQYVERLPHELPPDVRLDRIPEDRWLEDMLEKGELDAMVTFEPPEGFLIGGGRIRRLFEDYRSVERDYYWRTGHFPIMHMVVMRREILNSDPWAPRALMEAFITAKQIGQARLRNTTGLAVSVPWLAADLDEIATDFGGDAFPYGLAPNFSTLDAMIEYSREQGLISRRLIPQELFAESTNEMTG